MTLNPKEVLKQTFGYEQFRQGQNEIISSIVNKRNVLAIMPMVLVSLYVIKYPLLLMKRKLLLYLLLWP